MVIYINIPTSIKSDILCDDRSFVVTYSTLLVCLLELLCYFAYTTYHILLSLFVVLFVFNILFFFLEKHWLNVWSDLPSIVACGGQVTTYILCAVHLLLSLSRLCGVFILSSHSLSSYFALYSLLGFPISSFISFLILLHFNPFCLDWLICNTVSELAEYYYVWVVQQACFYM